MSAYQTDPCGHRFPPADTLYRYIDYEAPVGSSGHNR